MKRHFAEPELESLTMANCLMLLSQGREEEEEEEANLPSRVFECKTCNRQFPSFQALGGHRASHKKPRPAGPESQSACFPAKPKTHECSICGLEFAVGQALGGHMRRHRAGGLSDAQVMGSGKSASSSRESMEPPRTPHVVKRSNSRRVLCLDLNLTPFENDLELFRLGKVASMVDCFL